MVKRLACSREATVQVNESATPGAAQGTGGTGQPGLTPDLLEGVVGGFLHAKKDEQRHIHPLIVRQFKPETVAKLGLTPEFSQGQKDAAS